MANSGKTSKYRVLCVAVVLGCILFGILFFQPLVSVAQGLAGQPLPPAESKARLQQLGDSLRKYDLFYSFERNSLAMVMRYMNTPLGEKVKKLGIINDKGELVLHCDYDHIRQQDHSNLIMVSKGELAGFVDSQMNWVIPMCYQDIYSDLETDDFFFFGLINVADSATGKKGVIDSTGQQILPCKYDWIEICTPNCFLVGIGDMEGAVNRKGETIIPFIYSHLMLCGNYIRAKQNNKLGLLDTLGNVIIPLQFDNVGIDFNGSLLSVCKNDRWGLVDITGNMVIPYIYEKPLYESAPGLWSYGQYVQGHYKEGVVTSHGEVVLPCEYDFLRFSRSGDRILAYQTDLYGNPICYLYNRDGRLLDTLDEFRFDVIDEINHVTMIPVSRNGKWGFFNLDFQLVVPYIYDDVFGWNGYGLAKLPNNQTALLNESGEVLLSLPLLFDYTIALPSVNGWYYVNYGSRDPMYGGLELSGFIDTYGNSTFTKEELEEMKAHFKQ